MKVTKEMLHDDLKPYFFKHSLMATLIKQNWFRNFSNWMMAKALHGKVIEDLDCEERHIPSCDPAWKIRVRIYRPKGTDTTRLPAMLYFHPGGHLIGAPEMSGDIIHQFINHRPCVVIAPDYRKSHIRPFPAGFDDCYDTLLWARDNADELGISSQSFIVAGQSAGGGLAAAVTLKARDTQDVPIAFQMPFYPMIDDLQPADAARQIESPVWDSELNLIGWNAYLADVHSNSADITTYAAPARNSDFRNLPPTITFVGTLEPFHQETTEFVKALEAAGTEVKFKEFDGCYHGFDSLAPQAGISKEASKFTLDGYADFYDRHLIM